MRKHPPLRLSKLYQELDIPAPRSPGLVAKLEGASSSKRNKEMTWSKSLINQALSTYIFLARNREFKAPYLPLLIASHIYTAWV